MCFEIDEGFEEEYQEGFEEDPLPANPLPQRRIKPKTPVFSDMEIDVLVEHVNEKRHIIDNPATDAHTVAEKNQAWETITSLFAESANNLGIFTPRSQQQLKKKWENMKATARKIDSEAKQYMLATGGGPALILDPKKQRVMDIVKTVRPTIDFTLENRWDSTGELEPANLNPSNQHELPASHVVPRQPPAMTPTNYETKQPPKSAKKKSAAVLRPKYVGIANNGGHKIMKPLTSGQIDEMMRSQFKVFGVPEGDDGIAQSVPYQNQTMQNQAPSATITSGEYMNLVDNMPILIQEEKPHHNSSVTDQPGKYVDLTYEIDSSTRSTIHVRSPLKNVVYQEDAELDLSRTNSTFVAQDAHDYENIGPFQKRINKCQENAGRGGRMKRMKSLSGSPTAGKIEEDTKMKFQEEVYQEKMECMTYEKKFWIRRNEAADLEIDVLNLKKQAAQLKLKYYSAKLGVNSGEKDVSP